MMDYVINEWIEVRTDVMGGMPVLKGTRLDVETVIGYLLAGDAEEDIIAAFPSFNTENIKACKNFGIKMSGLKYSVVELKNVK